MKTLGLAALVTAALASGGCLVLALGPIYDGQTIEFDEALVGTWDRAEDGSSVVIGRGAWRSYDLAYATGDTTLKATAYATRIGEARFLDIEPQHGVDFGPLVVPAHAILRFQLARLRVVDAGCCAGRSAEAGPCGRRPAEPRAHIAGARAPRVDCRRAQNERGVRRCRDLHPQALSGPDCCLAANVFVTITEPTNVLSIPPERCSGGPHAAAPASAW
jgi:hypothetical protein